MDKKEKVLADLQNIENNIDLTNG